MDGCLATRRIIFAPMKHCRWPMCTFHYNVKARRLCLKRIVYGRKTSKISSSWKPRGACYVRVHTSIAQVKKCVNVFVLAVKGVQCRVWLAMGSMGGIGNDREWMASMVRYLACLVMFGVLWPCYNCSWIYAYSRETKLSKNWAQNVYCWEQRWNSWQKPNFSEFTKAKHWLWLVKIFFNILAIFWSIVCVEILQCQFKSSCRSLFWTDCGLSIWPWLPRRVGLIEAWTPMELWARRAFGMSPQGAYKGNGYVGVHQSNQHHALGH